MAKVLVHVTKVDAWETNAGLQERYRRFLPRIFLTSKIDPDRVEAHSTAAFWEVDETEVESLVRDLTRLNPGVPVRVYKLTSESVRPAGDMVTKQVTADGVLPI